MPRLPGADLTPMPVLTAPALPPARSLSPPFDAQGTLKSPTDLTAKLPFRKTVSENKLLPRCDDDVEVDRLLRHRSWFMALLHPGIACRPLLPAVASAPKNDRHLA